MLRRDAEKARSPLSARNHRDFFNELMKRYGSRFYFPLVPSPHSSTLSFFSFAIPDECHSRIIARNIMTRDGRAVLLCVQLPTPANSNRRKLSVESSLIVRGIVLWKLPVALARAPATPTDQPFVGLALFAQPNDARLLFYYLYYFSLWRYFPVGRHRVSFAIGFRTATDLIARWKPSSFVGRATSLRNLGIEGRGYSLSLSLCVN